MKPIRLEIQGINSYEEKQIIDFEKLISRGIFGIFGKTGSGKSTILDAITLSLYGNIARGTKGFINSNTDNAYVLFRFEILNGSTRDVYEVARKFKKKISDDKISVMTGTVKLSKITKYEDGTEEHTVLAERVKEVDNAVYEILGLTEDDFLKSVVLPQGKFSEFLLLNGKDKRNMLERLFGLENYGTFLNLKLQKNKGEVKNKIAVLEGKLAEFPDATEEKIKEYTDKLSKLNKNLEKLNEEYEKEKKLLEEYREINSILTERNNFEKQLNSIKNEEEKVKSIENRLLNFSKLKEVFIEIDRRDNSKKELDIIISDGKKLVVEVNGLEEKFSKLNELFEINSNLRDELPNIRANNFLVKEIYERESEYLDFVLENERLLKEINYFNNELKKITEEISLNEKELEKLNVEIQKLNIEEEKNSFSLDYREEINIASEVFVNIENLKSSKKEILDRKSKVEFEINVLIEELNKNTKIFEELTLEIKKIEDDFEKSRESQMISHIRQNLLKDSECVCPVCLNTVVNKDILSQNENVDNFNENTEKLENLKTEFEKIKLKNIQKETIINEKKNSLMDFENNLLNLEKEILNFEEKLNFYKNKYGDIDFKNEKLRIVEFEKKQIEIRKCREQFSFKKDKTIEENNKKIILRSELISKQDNFSHKFKDNEKNIKNIVLKIREYFRNFDFEKLFEWLGKNYNLEYSNFTENIEINKLNVDILTLKKLYADIEVFCTKLEENYSKLKIEKENFEKNLNDIREKHRNKQAEYKVKNENILNISKKIEELLTVNKYASESEVLIYKLTDREFEEFNEKIKQYNNSVTTLNGKIELLNSRLNGRSITEEILKEQDEKFEFTEKTLNSMRDESISLKIVLDTTMENLKKVEEYSTELNVFNKKLSTISQLEKVLKGNRFVEFLSKMYLNNIVFEASTRLDSITNGRYSLEIDSDYSFVISDNFNGGIRRAIDTLSGGEIFLTSLSLALSLSTQIQLKGSAPLEFFFLDEGFGTLDAELLDVVMESLEKLHSDKLSVGIISHVEELKNRIPTKLIVKMDKNKLTSIVNIEYS